MLEQQFYTLRELAEHWSTQNQKISVKQILQMGSSGKLPIYINPASVIDLNRSESGESQVKARVESYIEESAEPTEEQRKLGMPEVFALSAGRRMPKHLERLSLREISLLNFKPVNGEIFFYDSSLFLAPNEGLDQMQLHFLDPDSEFINPTFKLNVDCFFVLQTDVDIFNNSTVVIDENEDPEELKWIIKARLLADEIKFSNPDYPQQKIAEIIEPMLVREGFKNQRGGAISAGTIKKQALTGYLK